MPERHVLNVTETVIEVPGISRAYTFIHVTDTHLTELDHRDAHVFTDGITYKEIFDTSLPPNSSRQSILRQTIEESNALSADALIFTGDMMHYPSAANLDEFRSQVSRIQAPYLYTLGNHDWHFPSLPWNDETRLQYYSSFLEFTDDNPSYQMLDFGEIRLLTVDNSNYQINEEQLNYLKKQLSGSVPCLLFMHIPIQLPELRKLTINKWKAPILIGGEGWNDEDRNRWQVRAGDPSTQEFITWLKHKESKSLKAIFSGHVHFNHEEVFADHKLQCVTHPGYEGGYRIIRIVPSLLT